MKNGQMTRKAKSANHASTALICALLSTLSAPVNSSCTYAGMQTRLEIKKSNQWRRQIQSKKDDSQEWNNLISDIRKSKKALYCCSDSIDIYNIRIVVPTCNDVGYFYSSPFYIMGSMKNRAPGNFRLFWNTGGTHAEPGKTYELKIDDRYNPRIMKLIEKSFGVLPAMSVMLQTESGPKVYEQR